MNGVIGWSKDENGIQSANVAGYELQVNIHRSGASWLVRDVKIYHGGEEPTEFLAKCRCEAWLRINGVIP